VSPDSGPATRLLLGFCAMAESWLSAEAAPVDCKPHGGRFTAEEILRWSFLAPAVRAGVEVIDSAFEDGDGAIRISYRLVAAVVARDVAGRPDGRAGEARRLADRLCFELARAQEGEDGDALWPRAVFSAAELDETAADHRWGDIGDPLGIQAANLFRGEIDQENLALWGVRWTQQFCARPADFSIPLPEPAGIPHTVLSGRAPDVGPGHEDDYETVAQPPEDPE